MNTHAQNAHFGQNQSTVHAWGDTHRGHYEGENREIETEINKINKLAELPQNICSEKGGRWVGEKKVSKLTGRKAEEAEGQKGKHISGSPESQRTGRAGPAGLVQAETPVPHGRAATEP